MSTMGRKKNEILVGAFNALNEYYTEEKDFQIIAASGVDFILMAYLHDEKSDYNLSMLEKYGIKAFIYDVTLNTSDPATLTDETVLKLSAPYRHSPSFLGFGIIDEPAEEIFPHLGAEVRAIRHAIPDAPSIFFRGTHSTIRTCSVRISANLRKPWKSTTSPPMTIRCGSRKTAL